jgi:hypothetical protein
LDTAAYLSVFLKTKIPEKVMKQHHPKTSRIPDAKGYNPEASIHQEPDAVYAVSPQSQNLFRTVVGRHERKTCYYILKLEIVNG